MNCAECKENLVAYAEGLLPESQRRAVESHLQGCPPCRAELKHISALRDRLTANGNASTRIELENAVLDRILREQSLRLNKANKADRQLQLWRKIMKSRITKLGSAAAIIFCVLGLLDFFGNGETLYAQVMRGLKSARTIHILGESLRNGRWEKGMEAWYDRDIGVVEEDWRDDTLSSKRIDNGTHSWQYQHTNNLVKRSKSLSPMGVVADVLDVRKITEKGIRDPENDKVVNGERYFAYTRSNEESTHQICIWLDEAKRVRSLEKSHVLDNGQWETYRVAEVEYDVEINPEIFSPQFDADVRIVEIDTVLDEYFSLDKAISTKEALGFIFAIHELKRCEDNLIFTICSIRPTASTRSLVRASDPAVWAYGSFHLGSSWKRIDNYGRGRSFVPIRLAHAYHAGLEVQWVLFFPEGFEPEGPEECEFEVYISTISKLREERIEDGLPIKQNFKSMAILPLPQEQTALQQVMDDTYSTIMELEPLVAFEGLSQKLQLVPFTDEEMDAWAQKAPMSPVSKKWLSGDKSWRRSHQLPSSEISKEDWIKDRLGHLQQCKDRYKEFLEEVKKREQE